MKIQVSTDYAIRILQYLHKHRDVELHGSAGVAQEIGVTYPFFIKIVSQLRRHGLVVSTQGRNGGYALAKPAHEISLYDVYRCTAGELQINPCLAGEPCTKGEHKDCKLHHIFRDLQEGMREKLSSQTIADLVG